MNSRDFDVLLIREERNADIWIGGARNIHRWKVHSFHEMNTETVTFFVIAEIEVYLPQILFVLLLFWICFWLKNV